MYEDLESLANQDPQQAWAALQEPLQDLDTGVRRRAVRMIGRLNLHDSTSLRRLFEILREDPGWTVREAAVFSIAEISADAGIEQSEETLTTLIRATLQDSEPLVRRAALTASRQMAEQTPLPASALRLIDDAMQDHRGHLRCRAIEAISNFPELVTTRFDTLVQCLSDSHWKVRRTAVGSVCNWDKNLATAIPRAVRGLFDRESRVAAAARQALEVMALQIPDGWRPWYGVLLKGGEPAPLLDELIACEPSQNVAATFEFLCRRRWQWNLQKSGQTELSEQTPAGPIRPEAVINAAVSQYSENARERTARRESIWLLTRFVWLLAR